MDTIKTGIKSLDKKRKGGLRGGSLTVIAGRPGMGKSSLVFQIAGGNEYNFRACEFLAHTP